MKKNVCISKEWIKKSIKDFVVSSSLNTMQDGSEEPAWDDVLIGFASGIDEIWQQYKEYVGAFHWTPWEVFNQHNPNENVSAEELTVISWVLPQRKSVRNANRQEKKFPAEEWARIRVYGEKFNIALRRHLVEKLEKKGYAAVAPMLVPNWTIVKSKRFSYASSWSERHAAHAAGLGTFGLCDGLITSRGKAMRTGSVVAKISIKPTPRPYIDHHAYCLYYTDKTCGICIKRCPAHAITEDGHDKEKCRLHLDKSRKYVKKNMGLKDMDAGCARSKCLVNQ